ncbi:hypothetical protein ACNKHM_10465 [Shigella sonnei]
MTHDNIDILVVDDDISHCTIPQALLRVGYNVALANSGRQALEQVRNRFLILCFAMYEWQRWMVSPTLKKSKH